MGVRHIVRQVQVLRRQEGQRVLVRRLTHPPAPQTDPESQAVPVTNCATVCSYGSYLCGGDNALVVYEKKPTNVGGDPPAGDWNYLGCFDDSDSMLLLPDAGNGPGEAHEGAHADAIGMRRAVRGPALLWCREWEQVHMRR